MSHKKPNTTPTNINFQLNILYSFLKFILLNCRLMDTSINKVEKLPITYKNSQTKLPITLKKQMVFMSTKYIQYQNKNALN